MKKHYVASRDSNSNLVFLASFKVLFKSNSMLLSNKGTRRVMENSKIYRNSIKKFEVVR
jgi:hypothetical protein